MTTLDTSAGSTTDIGPDETGRFGDFGGRFMPEALMAALDELTAGGARRVLVVPTSAWRSYSSCRQYREGLAEAVEGRPGLVVDKVRPFGEHPGFAATLARDTLAGARAAVEAVGADAVDPRADIGQRRCRRDLGLAGSGRCTGRLLCSAAGGLLRRRPGGLVRCCHRSLPPLHPCRCWKSRMKPTSACAPATGMAL